MDEQLDFASLPHPPSALYRDFLAAGAAAKEFYVGPGWSLEQLQASAERSIAYPRDRAGLVAALVRQQETRGAAAAVAQAQRLADPRSAVIVTGQQAVLFGGPLLVLYKALAARRLARELEALRGAPVVPVFWVASDDHDFAEVRFVDVLDTNGAVRTLRYAPATEPTGLPAARIVLDDSITALVDELRQALPAAPNRDDVVALVAECYRPGQTLAGAFAAWLQKLLPDVVFLDPADPALKALMLPVMRREIEESSPTSRLAAEAGTRLETAGYHQQVQVRSGFLNLFVVEDGERRALGIQDGRVDVRGLDRRWTSAEALAALEQRPEDWSPGALLRPLAEDHLLPTAAYVGGPAEIAYHAQIGPAYAHFGIPRPALVPRPALTLIEPTQARAIEAEEVTLLDLLGDPNELSARRANAAFPEVERAFGVARESIAASMGPLENVLAEIDPTLRGAAESARGRALHQLEGLQEKATRALKKRDETRSQRLQRTRDALFPGGTLQERRLGLVGLVARHGLGIVDELERRLDPWARTHQVLYL